MMATFAIPLFCFCPVHSFAGTGGKGKFAYALTVTGKIVDDKGTPLGGATVTEKGTKNSTLTKSDGSFTLTVSKNKAVLVISFVGYTQQEVTVNEGQSDIFIHLAPSQLSMDSIVVVGYGRQRKQSVVGAITQTTGAVLQRAGGVSTIGGALTGNVPGVITVQGSGTPGAEDPTIYIRGQSTMNGSNPLILVDGIERPMSGVDVGSVESISVLKDASATAVFGVKGANGVILITTKRGVEGKANINVTANTTVKIPSRIPQKYDSYDALKIRNWAIERELALNPSSWADYTPYALLDKYRHPANQQEAEQYPNIDWQDETVKDFATSNNLNVNISGGSSFVKYYTALDLLHEGDIMKVPDNGKGYKPGFYYNRLNVRANLDFKLTSTTTLAANLSGLSGNKQDTWNGFEYTWYQSIYALAPDIFYPRYSDGSWGYYPNDPVRGTNTLQVLANSGVRNTKTTQINSDFTLTQDLGMLMKNLSVKGTFAMDNTFVTQGGIFDDGSAILKYVDRDGRVTYKNTAGTNQFDYVLPLWSTRPDAMQNPSTYRRKFYQAQVNHSARFGKHNLTEMGLVQREEYARGSEFPHYREDWVFRATYNYANRYFAEFNGAYNGSEMFSPEYRFGFFPSAAAGWTVTNEKFMRNISWLTNLKIRGSYGLVGDDRPATNFRWLYQTQWSSGGQTRLGDQAYITSPYVWYKEFSIGNPDLHWETATKANFGVDYSLLNGLVEGSFDLFQDYRYDILLPGNQRAVPAYFGNTPPVANLGKVKVRGFEVELKFNKRFNKNWRLWSNMAATHAKDKILFADDPQLLDAYLKRQDYQIGQSRSTLRAGYYNTWDEVYGSSRVNQYDIQKLPGNFNLVDFNGDGVIDGYDNVPYAYPSRPQNTYTGTIGFDYKRLSFFVQFYGVNNVSRELTQGSFDGSLNAVYKQGDYWTMDNPTAASPLPRWKSLNYSRGDFYYFDASYVRLKSAEIAYSFNPEWLRKRGIQSMRVYLNGNNLFLWSKMPDDREANIGGAGYSGQGAYPTLRRINLGLNLSL
ncbi:SusC/RagA family TonB-linked outer membrane protein [Flavisolibacter nicotianae]|uniref:SusC/RagA family TonB-linked outer membrane protein n=1 Tax=Flavisolibacter nicotianae TaxID=2364882 RepID=UPI000EACA6D7|nr:TonB-dependent receptor [Flavisolibacter nicotianae]